MSETVACEGTLWRWSQNGSPIGGWFFLTIAGLAADEIRGHATMRKLETGSARGFGSVRVKVQIGGSVWQTSVFPSNSHEGYVLPIKSTVRKAEDLSEGDGLSAILTLL